MPIDRFPFVATRALSRDVVGILRYTTSAIGFTQS
jgi:hypothetical protein